MTDDTSNLMRVIPVVDRFGNPPISIFVFVATAVQCPHQLKPSDRQTHLLPGLKRRGAGLSKGYSSRLGHSSLMVPRCRLHTGSDWLCVL